MGDFEALAKAALGTDDPDRIAAFKEAVMACMGGDEEEMGEEDEEMGGEMESGKGSGLAALFGKG